MQLKGQHLVSCLQLEEARRKAEEEAQSEAEKRFMELQQKAQAEAAKYVQPPSGTLGVLHALTFLLLTVPVRPPMSRFAWVGMGTGAWGSSIGDWIVIWVGLEWGRDSDLPHWVGLHQKKQIGASRDGCLTCGLMCTDGNY